MFRMDGYGGNYYPSGGDDALIKAHQNRKEVAAMSFHPDRRPSVSPVAFKDGPQMRVGMKVAGLGYIVVRVSTDDRRSDGVAQMHVAIITDEEFYGP